ncbi:MAG: long-chain acyl-CoA synthetase, partial [Solirubrobacteraceae bacterium]|nr:long-chain acyl-CoA synthetase [Solirubrobacteraceae bacterium]
MGIYEDRPWLARYGEGQPADIEPEHESALAMFQATARRLPDAPAIHYFDATLTHRDVDELSDALAAALAARGVGPGDRVALYLQNVPQFPIAALAAWKAGAIAVSVNPMLKQRELDTLLNDSGAVALVTHESLWRDVARATVPGTSVATVVTTSELDFLGDEVPVPLRDSARDRDAATLDLVELTREHAGERPPDPGLRLDDVAFLTYTSGTTGPPKGAMNTHRNIVFNAQTYRDWIGLDEGDVALAVAPLFHITGLIEHMAIGQLTGMPIVLAHRFDPDVALELVERHRVTFSIGSITVFIALMNASGAGERDTSTFRKLVSGGAPIAPSTVEAFERRFGAYIHNIYGLTETTSPSHCVPIGTRAPVDQTSGALSVGVPVYSTVVRVVGEDGEEVAPGELGEFLTSGPQVVPGYWEQPEETEHGIPGGELRTGDVGFMDADGWFYLVDRKKDQINAAGYKVWPREVEDVLYGHPAVREAAVVGVPDEYRGETVVAFVSLKGDATEDDLIAHCRERMAAYKYPRRIEFLDELP